MTRRFAPAGVILLAAAGALAWWLWGGGEEQAIRQRLDSLCDVVNESVTDGLGTIAHAAEIGSFFTSDVTIDFGAGTSALHGRETVIGMAARLQPRTATFKVDLDDVNVTLTGSDAADVTLTTTFERRSLTTGEEAMDAREFALVMSKAEGQWQIARATTVQTLKRTP